MSLQLLEGGWWGGGRGAVEGAARGLWGEGRGGVEGVVEEFELGKVVQCR